MNFGNPNYNTADPNDKRNGPIQANQVQIGISDKKGAGNNAK